MATDAARLESEDFTEVKNKTVLTSTGLLMEGLIPRNSEMALGSTLMAISFRGKRDKSTMFQTDI